MATRQVHHAPTAKPTPYAARQDGSLGYDSHYVADDIFYVEFAYNGFTSDGQAQEYFERRCSEVCEEEGFPGWEIVESSEAGMLTQVRKAISKEDWIVFLGWEPHPMNLDYQITYLAGADVEFGPNFGGATVRTISRKGYAGECPNVARFFTKLVFDIDYENHGMRLIMNDGNSPEAAAGAMLKQNPAKLERWLDGVYRQ